MLKALLIISYSHIEYDRIETYKSVTPWRRVMANKLSISVGECAVKDFCVDQSAESETKLSP